MKKLNLKTFLKELFMKKNFLEEKAQNFMKISRTRSL